MKTLPFRKSTPGKKSTNYIYIFCCVWKMWLDWTSWWWLKCEIKVTYIQWWDKKSSSQNCSMMTASKMGPKNIYQSNKYGFFLQVNSQVYKCISAPLALGRRWPSWPKKLTQFQNVWRLNWDPNTLKLHEKQKCGQLTPLIKVLIMLFFQT